MKRRRKVTNCTFIRFVSIILALIMFLGVTPLEAVYAQDVPEVMEINVYRTFQDLSDRGTYGISVSGKGLSRVNISYQEEATDEFIPLTNPLPGSDDTFRQFRVDPGIVISRLRVGNKTFNINETDMPKINKIEPEQINLTRKDAQVTLTGRNFKNFGESESMGKTTIEISNNDLTDKFESKGNGDENKVTLKWNTLDGLGHGIKHIVIENKFDDNGVDIITTYNQRNAFRIYESIKIDEDDATIYPNRGKKGTEVSITIKNDQYQYSVFFLEDETRPFMYENMGVDPQYIRSADRDGIIRIRVPESLQTGKTYKVIITNNLENKKGAGKDLTDDVTKQATIGEFYVVDADVGPTITKVVPNEGTSAGSYVTIYGHRFEELKIGGLQGVDDVVTKDKLDIIFAGQDEPTKLRINYYQNNKDSKITYNQEQIKHLTRDFLVTIGRDALFEEGHIDKNVFINGDSQDDRLYVRTKTIDGEDLRDPVKDVVIEITTTIETEENSYIFTEVTVLPRGYTFLPSHQDPQIDRVTPDKIQISESGSGYETKDKIILSIQGKDFNVFRYTENGDTRTNYPKVAIGGIDEDNAEIVVEKDGEGKIFYYVKDNSGQWIKPEKPATDVIFEVLDRNGRIVNGVGGNEVGNSIVLIIPEGIPITTINKILPVAVSNPKRDSKDRGIYSFRNDIISFVTVPSSPIIEEINPYIITVEGGEDITIKGRNFDDGIRVFIDGQEVPNVTRDIDRETTRGTLKFKAPPGREGTNIVQVMNPDGGSDTHEFIYVQTMRIDPRITSVNPPRGTRDTLVVIKGDNFLKPDQTVSSIKGLGLYRLIGSRVFLGNEDVNKYTTLENGLEQYSTPDVKDEFLFKKERNIYTNLDELVLSPYYKNAVLSEGTGDSKNYYVINIDYEGNPVIIGKNESYTFKLLNGDIKAIDKAGKIFDVTLNKNALTIKSQKVENEDTGDGNTEREDKTIVIDISYDYKLFSIGKNEFGYSYLKVADYYDSLILEEDGNFYTIETDDTGKITLSDGKTNTYEIRLDKDGEIVAVKGSTSAKLDVNNNNIIIGDKKILNFKTPFAIDADTGIIIGHRAKVKNRNEIWVTIPEKELPGFYDVTVRNPDTKSFTVKDGFEYLKPQSQPKINYISPNQGSVEGGYEITIYGEGFQNTTEVYIAGEKVPNADIKIDTVNYTSINITVPKYPGDVSTDFITDRKYVPVTVLNEDGGSDSTDNLFAYVLASSRPRIDRINPASGTAAGGDVVEIWGYDFRYFEPYKGKKPGDGDVNYEDLDRDGEWTHYSTDRDVPEKFKKPIEHKNFDKYIDSPVLPKIYFGREEAKIVEFSEGYIKVITPRSATLGAADVYLLNNDAGTTNKVRFTYEGSNPNIKAIIPNVGRRQGGEKIDIEGSNFKINNINVIDENNKQQKINSHLVRFGNVSNINIPREAENSGLINQGVATVNLDGGLKVEHKAVNGSSKIIVSITESSITYTQEYDYDFGAKFIDVRGLKDEDGKNYTRYELIKIEVVNGRLLVTRGFSPKVEERFTGHLEVLTPTYYSIGNVNVVVENPDGVSNEVVFQYRNPDSRPRITNITRDGQQPHLGDDGKIKILPVNIKSGSTLVIEGSDFRDVELIQIGNALRIEPRDILINEPNKLVFKMPIIDDIYATTFLHRVVVVNEDGGTASSDEAYPQPIYIQLTKGESNPQIENINPPRGPATGGNTVIIKGKDFRKTMEGYVGENLRVYFDGKQILNSNVRVIDHQTVSVVAPSGNPGPVEVKIENPDGEISNSVQYTYASDPKITAVVDPLDPAEKSIISAVSIEGGQELKLKGTGFMKGATVYFAPKVIPISENEQNIGRVIYIEGKPHILEEGTAGTNFEFINEETVIIKTPPLKAGSTGVIIVNPDNGASPVYTNIIYGLPELAAPSGVTAELVYDRFIKVHWHGVSGATQYEIFEITDDAKVELIGSTQLTSFVYSDLKPRTRYRFVIKAVGDFGSSKPSLESNTVRTGRIVGPPDEDGALGEETLVFKSGDIANVIIGTKDKGIAPMTIDLTRGNLAGSTEMVISIPAEVIVNSGNKNIQVIGKDFLLNFKLSAFNTAVVRENRDRADAGVRFIIKPDKGNTHIPLGNQLSTIYNLDATVYVGKINTAIDRLANSINLALDYDIQKADIRKLNYVSFNHFNPETNGWQSTGLPTSTSANAVSGIVNRLGKFTVIGSRR